MKTAPGRMPAKAPVSPNVTDRKSSSLPTQAKTKSQSVDASRGVDALDPPNLPTHLEATAGGRLYTTTSWPPRDFRCPAIGNPMTPSPEKRLCPRLDSSPQPS